MMIRTFILSLLAVTLFCSSANAASLRCWIGDRQTDELAENFIIDTKRKTLEWSGGEASHATISKFLILGKKAVIAVILKPAMQGKFKIVEDEADKLFSIFFDGENKFYIQGDREESGTCD